ncbi:hypothetical protein MLD38_018803 [Melastoma candidum]|uniref:Uncharacterized protein n=1 Tax=Melastoma candidum TaxID=119954 RepID=A0ACB9QUZ5_9MYRT|nr:hypothetical protein MLD38_018803 [Melastoma candidum]
MPYREFLINHFILGRLPKLCTRDAIFSFPLTTGVLWTLSLSRKGFNCIAGEQELLPEMHLLGQVDRKKPTNF